MSGRIAVIIPAAGSGKRLGGVSKPLIEIDGRPIISRLLDLFASYPGVTHVSLAVPESSFPDFKKIIASAPNPSAIRIVGGGKERAVSVRNAFESVRLFLEDDDLVCIHDAARPLLSYSDLERVIASAGKHRAAFLASRVKDTLKVVNPDGMCESTIDRTNLFAAQTPQVMTKKLLSDAYDSVGDFAGMTDEIMLLEAIGVKAFAVEAEHPNLKITSPEDLELVKKFVS